VSHRLWIVAGLVAAMGAVPAEGHAQDRMFRGLFRASEDPAHSRTKMDVISSADFGWSQTRYDSTLFGVIERPVSVSGNTPGFSGSLSFSHRGRRIDTGLAGGGYYRSYSRLPDLSFPSFYQVARVSAQVGERVELRFNETATYARFYGYQRAAAVTVPSDVTDVTSNLVVPENNYYAERRSNYIFSGGGEAQYRVGQHSTLVGYGSLRHVNFTDSSPDLSSGSIGGRYNQRLTRFMTLHAGYGFNIWQYPGDNVNLYSNDIHGGVSYARPLPVSDRTRVGFDVSTAFVSAPDSTQFRVNGYGFVSYVLSRSWAVSGVYRRDTTVEEGFAVPFFLFSDSIGGSLTGSIKRRVLLTASGGYSVGRYEVASIQNRTHWVDGSLTATTVLFRTLAAYVTGGTGQYDFERRIGLLRGTPLSSTSIWFHAGLTFRLPLMT
jgi:hypothetical protein